METCSQDKIKPQIKNTFYFIMIKPSHYDDEGYVIQWLKSSIPSNTLAVLNGLALDCAERQVLGEDTDFSLETYDETNIRIDVEALSTKILESGGHALIALVGVQTNQFPRAVDIARKFRAKSLQVCIGGFHVSGCLAMLPKITPDLQEAIDMGISLFAGEVEGRLESLFQEAYSKKMKPLYNYMDDLPNMEGVALPYLPLPIIKRTSGYRASFDAGRGCPFLCSFCTIINVQGHKSRYRSADDVEGILRTAFAEGITNFFISDDDFARNRQWEAIFDRLIKLKKEEGLEVRLIIQVDTMCHKLPRFIEKAGLAGVTRVFIGLETINADSLKAAKKKQNKFEEYRNMLDAWHDAGALTYAGYILGFPQDTPASILEDIKTIQRELPIDLLEFFILTPLPGSEDHKVLFEKGVEMEKDMNNYDVVHITTAHATMSDKEWIGIYEKAWDAYYTPEHVETVIRRAQTWGFDVDNMMQKLLHFYACPKIEKMHPLEGGLLRLKYRKDRRYGMPIENPLIFYPRYVFETISKFVHFGILYFRFKRILKRVKRTPPQPRTQETLEDPLSVITP